MATKKHRLLQVDIMVCFADKKGETLTQTRSTFVEVPEHADPDQAVVIMVQGHRFFVESKR